MGKNQVKYFVVLSILDHKYRCDPLLLFVGMDHWSSGQLLEQEEISVKC